MNPRDRYDTSNLVEGQFEPGSRRRVLRNLLGIRRKRAIDAAEATALSEALERCVDTFGRRHRFTAKDIREIHRFWLGTIYAWAGRYRQVAISKGDFTFAVPAHIDILMTGFETGPLHRFTPCTFDNQEEVARALAEVHVELMLIHPFREGNGRTGRLLATLMALQAGLPILDFSGVHGTTRDQYFAAVRAGLNRDYGPMEKLFSAVIGRTLRTRPF